MRALAPSPWVARFSGLVRPGGDVLDVACGGGRHVRYFEQLGHRVTAIDRDVAALATCGATETIAFDLESDAPWPLSSRRFAAVVVTNYLHRPLFPALLAALADDAVLIYETFAAGQATFGKPSNPDFLLQPGELLRLGRDATAGVDVVAFEDGLVIDPRPASIQRICAVHSRPRGVAPVRHRLSRDLPR